MLVVSGYGVLAGIALGSFATSALSICVLPFAIWASIRNVTLLIRSETVLLDDAGITVHARGKIRQARWRDIDHIGFKTFRNASVLFIWVKASAEERAKEKILPSRSTLCFAIPPHLSLSTVGSLDKLADIIRSRAALR